MVVIDCQYMRRRLPEARANVGLKPAQHRIHAPIAAKLHQLLADQAGKPCGIAPAGGQLLVGHPGGAVDHPGEAAVQADPVLVDAGAWYGKPVQRPEKRIRAGDVHSLTGLILVALCPDWS